MPDKVLRYSGSFCSTVAFAILHLGKTFRGALARGRLDPKTVTSSFAKSSVFTFHTKTRKRRFQKSPLWRAFSKICVFGHRFHLIRVDGRPIRKEKVAFSNENGCVDGALSTNSKLTKWYDTLELNKGWPGLSPAMYAGPSSSTLRTKVMYSTWPSCWTIPYVCVYQKNQYDTVKNYQLGANKSCRDFSTSYCFTCYSDGLWCPRALTNSQALVETFIPCRLAPIFVLAWRGGFQPYFEIMHRFNVWEVCPYLCSMMCRSVR